MAGTVLMLHVYYLISSSQQTYEVEIVILTFKTRKWGLERLNNLLKVTAI